MLDVGVARGRRIFLHATDRLRAVGQRRTRLRAAEAVNSRRPCCARGEKESPD